MASLRALLSDDNLVEVFHFDVLDNDLTLERSENVVNPPTYLVVDSSIWGDLSKMGALHKSGWSTRG